MVKLKPPDGFGAKSKQVPPLCLNMVNDSVFLLRIGFCEKRKRFWAICVSRLRMVVSQESEPTHAFIQQ